MVLGHAGHERVGPPGHGGRPGTVSEGRRRHVGSERSGTSPVRRACHPGADCSAVLLGGHPFAVAAEGQALRKVDHRFRRSTPQRGRIEHVEVAGATVRVVDDGEEPTFVVAVSIAGTYEDGLAGPAPLPGAPGGGIVPVQIDLQYPDRLDRPTEYGPCRRPPWEVSRPPTWSPRSSRGGRIAPSQWASVLGYSTNRSSSCVLVRAASLRRQRSRTARLPPMTESPMPSGPTTGTFVSTGCPSTGAS